MVKVEGDFVYVMVPTVGSVAELEETRKGRDKLGEYFLTCCQAVELMVEPIVKPSLLSISFYTELRVQFEAYKSKTVYTGWTL